MSAEICLRHGGREVRGRNAYSFDHAHQTIAPLSEMGCVVDLPPSILDRVATIVFVRRQILVEVPFVEGDQLGWCEEGTGKRRHHYKIVGHVQQTDQFENLDDRIRCLSTPTHEPAGWAVKVKSGDWSYKDASAVFRVLQTDHEKSAVGPIMGGLELSPWVLVVEPFKPEEPEGPGGRKWNPRSPQLRYEPLEGPFPTWKRLLAHVGRELDAPLQSNDWAKANGIRTGADYLGAWYACVVRHPLARLPYIFLHGPENNGKSSFWEAFELLVTHGVVKADRALTSQNDFNGELLNCILAVVEEKDISQSPGAAAKIKDAVTALKLSIRRMRTDSFSVPNYTHWVQCANHQDACPIAWGSTRIMSLAVDAFGPGEEVAKEKFHALLVNEAPAFTHYLKTMPLPEIVGRLALEVIDTPSKAQATEGSIPEFVRAVAERGSFQGTAAELADRIGDGPRDFRKAKRLLDTHSSFLRSQGVCVQDGPKVTRGRLITITTS